MVEQTEEESFEEFRERFDREQREASFKGRLKEELKTEGGKTLEKLGEVKKGVRKIDPLKGLVKKSSGKRKRGRPRKYKPQPQSQRPVGRPDNVSFSLSGQPIVSRERMMGEVPRRDAGRQMQQREQFVPPTKAQLMMNEILGQSNQMWGFGGNPIRINRTLNSGNGIIKSGDGGQTSSFFGGWRR